MTDSPDYWLPSALTGIGLASIVTEVDSPNTVREMNAVAESLTGWPAAEATGRPLPDVFRIQRAATRQPIPDPLAEVLATGVPAALSDHTILVARNGREFRIDHGAVPIRDAAGTVVGVAVLFCDVSQRERTADAVEDARAFADGIVQTVRDPLVVLDAELRVLSANTAFYTTFRVTPPDTERRSFFALGNGHWDTPALHVLMEQILPHDSAFDGFAVDREFAGLGRRSMLLSGRRLPPTGHRPALILLTVQDATERLLSAETLAVSEVRYRRLFETAQDGILLVDPDTRQIFDANPFLSELIGYTRAELIGKELWQIGLFGDIESSKAAFRILQETGYIRYHDLPLRTKDGRGIEVEFVSNVYTVGVVRVIQCNVRDVTAQKRAEAALQAAHDDLERRVTERTAELAATNASLTDEITRRELAEADRRALQQQLTTVQEDERRRIARELHDQMGQHLAALGLGLKAAKDATPQSSAEWERLQGLQSLADLMGREVHQLALELRPTALDDLGIHTALANYADAWSERFGVAVDFHAVGADAPRLPLPVETALYRIVQEALTNVGKHAAAGRVSVVLRRTTGLVSAVIEDNGVGFDDEFVDEHRLGILGMRERAVLVGGTLEVESGVGRGTTVIARIPLFPSDGEAPT